MTLMIQDELTDERRVQTAPGFLNSRSVFAVRKERLSSPAVTGHQPLQGSDPALPNSFQTVLVIEDNLGLRDMVREYLEAHGIRVQVASNGQEGLVEIRHALPDLIILDVTMPKLGGFEFLRIFRASWQTPVIVLTARDTEEEKILGLEIGADDYMTKPFSLAELLARVRANLRRSTAYTYAFTLSFGEWQLHSQTRRLYIQGVEVELTRSEFDLLLVLMEHPGRVFTRRDLLGQLQDDARGVERTIDVHVRNLRVKVEPDPSRPRWLETVYGVGYRFNPEAGP